MDEALVIALGGIFMLPCTFYGRVVEDGYLDVEKENHVMPAMHSERLPVCAQKSPSISPVSGSTSTLR